MNIAYNLGVIFNSDFDDLILDINSIKLLISAQFLNLRIILYSGHLDNTMFVLVNF